MKLIMKRLLREKAGDCLFMVRAHSHKLLSLSPAEMLYLNDDGKNLTQGYTGSKGVPEMGYIHPDLRYYGCAGSALRTYADPEMGISGYAEKAEYDPVELGYLRAEIKGSTVVSWEKAVVG